MKICIRRIGRILEDGSVEGEILTEMYSVGKRQIIINALLEKPLTKRNLMRKVGHKFDNQEDLYEQVNTLEKGNLIKGVRVTGKPGRPSTVYHRVQGLEGEKQRTSPPGLDEQRMSEQKERPIKINEKIWAHKDNILEVSTGEYHSETEIELEIKNYVLEKKLKLDEKERKVSLHEELDTDTDKGRVIPPEKPPEKPLKPPEPTPTIIESPEFLDLIEDIKRLKKDPDRTERDHEARVASFYKLLGYSNEEILFRRGSVDVSIMVPDEQTIVNEVKKDLSLKRKDKMVIRQAYGYAVESGARLVVVTNGDYYALYDRERGLDLDSNFLGEFWLTSLTEEGLELIEVLRKP